MEILYQTVSGVLKDIADLFADQVAEIFEEPELNRFFSDVVFPHSRAGFPLILAYGMSFATEDLTMSVYPVF